MEENEFYPVISVILPCYNSEKYIDRCYNSLKNQTYKNFEAIFINDGSTDNTLNILKAKLKNSNRFNVYSFANQGISQARNEGLKLAKGEYVYFMDPDDDIEFNAFEVLIAELFEDKYDAIQFKYKALNEDGSKGWTKNGNKKPKVYEQDEIIQNFLPGIIGYPVNEISLYGSKQFDRNSEFGSVWRYIYRKDLLINNNITFPKGVDLRQDGYFNCTFFCYASKIKVIENKLYTYYLKKSGAMYSGMEDNNLILKNKMDGIYEREKLRMLYLRKHSIDIRPMYAGSLFLSLFELAYTLNKGSIATQIKSTKKYISHPEVNASIKLIPLKGSLKIKMAILFAKIQSAFLIVIISRLADKLNLKIRNS